MQKWTFASLLAILVLVATVVTTLPATAEVNAADVAQLQPFSAESNYMSLPGLLRWKIFAEEGRWIPRLGAVRQIKAAGGNPTVTYEDTIALRRQAGEVSQ